MADRPITAKTLGDPFLAVTNLRHAFGLVRATRHLLEIEDVHFHHDSAVLLPDNPPENETTAPADPGDPPAGRVTAAAVLARCLREAERNPSWRLLVTGHADTSGGDAYNVTLSQERADCTRAVLIGDKRLFRRVATGHGRVEDYQRILKWLARDWGFSSDPGAIDNQHGNLTRDAVRAFKRDYRAEFGVALADTGTVDGPTWDAFFDCYQRELQEVIDLEDADLARIRDGLRFFDASHDSVGCGENWPIEDPARPDFRSVADRRIELVFFEDTDLPRLDCHLRRGACDARHCQVYDPRLFRPEVIPVDPVLPRRVRVSVHLALSWTDPDGTDRRFPGDLPVVVEHRDGTHEDHRLDADGVLAFVADRRRGAFTLRFDPGADAYFASAPPSSVASPTERLATATEAERLASEQHFRAWKLPDRFSLAECTFAVDASAPSYAAPFFELTGRTIGTPSTPAAVTLDPRWQFLRFEYFDRRYGAGAHGNRRIAVPPIFVAGSRTAPATGSGPVDTRSSWTIGGLDVAARAQALPWALQHHADGSADARPAPGTMLHFTSPGRSFIVATSETERHIEVIGDDARLGPSAARLALYDLPEVWRARSYQARPSDGSAAAAFESLTQAQLDASMAREHPIAFSLDDIILRVDDPGALLLAPDGTSPPSFPGWNPASQNIAVFSSTLQNGPNPQDIGPFQPQATASTFSQATGRLASAASIVYVSDYPDWTRAVVFEGDVFDVFDQRAVVGSDQPGQVVGARVGVLHRVSSTLQAPGADPARPAAVRGGRFCVMQPFFEQRHDAWYTAGSDDDSGIGRADLVLLRCCGAEPDGVTERARLLVYFRFFVNFAPTFQPDFNSGHATALGLAGAAAATWIDTAVRNIPRRWTGPDVPANPGQAVLAGPRLHATVVWFAQHVRRAIAHYELGVFRPTLATDPDIRAYMGSDTGIGVLGDPGVLHQPDNQAGADGWFTSAHESGHGSSLGDEYVENTAPIGFVRGFDGYSPGSAYELDSRAMMQTNKEVRARYFWHLAEWLRTLQGGDFEVRHGGHRYRLPHHPSAPARSYVNWPLRQALGATHGSHGKFDVYFFALGDDDYSVRVLPAAVRPGVRAFDALIIILVKMEFDFHVNNQARISSTIQQIDAQIRFRLNNRFLSSCHLDGRAYDRCLVSFSPRYQANHFSTGTPVTGRHFKVSTNDSDPPDWDDTIFGLGDAKHHLHWPLNQSAYVFSRYFREMCGLPRTEGDDLADLAPIVRTVAPDATVALV